MDMCTVQHATALMQTMRLLYRRHLLTDLDIIVTTPRHKTVPVHKVVMATFCSYFRDKLEDSALYETQHVLEGVDYVPFSTLLDFMYTGHMELNNDNISDILSLASRLGAPMAIDYCQEYMKTMTESVTGGMLLDLSSVPVDPAHLEPSQAFQSDTESVIEVQKTPRTYTRKRKIKIEADPETSLLSNNGNHGNYGKRPKRTNRSSRKTLDENIDMKKADNDVHLEMTRGRKTISKRKGRKKTPRNVKKPGDNENDVKPVDLNLEKIKREDSLPVDVYSSTPVYMAQVQHCRICKKPFLSVAKRQFHERRHGVLPLSLKISNWRSLGEISRFCIESSSQQVLMDGYTNYSPDMGSMLSVQGRTWCHNVPNLHDLNAIDHNGPACSRLINRICSKVYKRTLKVFNISRASFNCLICQQEFPLYSLLQVHFVLSHRRKHKCTCCFQRFPSARSMLLHQRLQHVESSSKRPPQFRCQDCSQAFLHRKTLDRHLKQNLHCKSSLVLLYCENCDKSYKKGSIFAHHPCYALTFPALNTRYQNVLRLNVIAKSIIKKLPKTKTRGKLRNPRRPRIYQCQYCRATFKLRYLGDLHVRLRHRKSRLNQKIWDYKQRRMECDEPGCTHKCITMLRLIRHVRAQHPDVIHRCAHDRCPYFTPVLRRLAQHTLKQHSGGNSCEICGKKYVKLQQLRIHRVAIHNQHDPKVTAYPCQHEDCNYVAYTKQIIDQHQQKHTAGGTHPCPYCDRRLKTQKNWTKHINKVHMGIRPFICDQCGANYGEDNELKMHMARHEKDWKYHCEHCDYITQDKGNLKSHMFYRHKLLLDKNQKLFRCDICDYTTHRKARFNDHMNIHGNVRQFQCKLCDKRFITKATMEGHIKWKHRNKDVQCTFCDYKTKTNNHLKEHVRVMHTERNVKPYKCPYCNFHCATGGNCRKHVMNKHKGKEVRWVKMTDEQLAAETAARAQGIQNESLFVEYRPGSQERILGNVVPGDVFPTRQVAAPTHHSVIEDQSEQHVELTSHSRQQIQFTDQSEQQLESTNQLSGQHLELASQSGQQIDVSSHLGQQIEVSSHSGQQIEVSSHLGQQIQFDTQSVHQVELPVYQVGQQVVLPAGLGRQIEIHGQSGRHIGLPEMSAAIGMFLPPQDIHK